MNEAPRRAPPADDRAGMFALLAFFWAVAVGTHQAQGEIVRPTASVLLTIAGTALLVRPSSVALLLCVIAGQLVDVALHWPAVPQHWLLLAAAGLWLLLGTAVLWLNTRRLPGPAEVYARHAPGLRVLLVLGCALMLLAKLDVASVVARPDAAAHAALLLEIGILVLLCLRSTRTAGLLIGSVYHVVLGTFGAYDLSAVILALYVPFLGDDFAARMKSVLARAPAAARGFSLWLRFIGARATLPALLLLALALAFGPHVLGWDPLVTERATMQVYRVLWLDPAGLLPTMLVAAWWYERRPAG